jgi:cell division protein ZapA (FtsZ GTPase activity inhibitor)
MTMNPQGDHLVELDILGQTFQVRVHGSPERAQRVGGTVDETMRKIQKETRLTDMTKTAILAALNLADRLLTIEASRKAYEERVEDASKQVSDVLEEALR